MTLAWNILGLRPGLNPGSPASREARENVAASAAIEAASPDVGGDPPLLKLRRASAPVLRSCGAAKEDADGPGESGFTLIEVLVALTILSISLAALLAIFLQGLDRAKESSNEAAARVLAQSLLTQAKAAQSLSFGSSTGKINGLQWRMAIEPYGSAADRAAWQTIPAELVATVTWRGDGGMRSLKLSTLKLYPNPKAINNDNNDDNSDDN